MGIVLLPPCCGTWFHHNNVTSITPHRGLSNRILIQSMKELSHSHYDISVVGKTGHYHRGHCCPTSIVLQSRDDKAKSIFANGVPSDIVPHFGDTFYPLWNEISIKSSPLILQSLQLKPQFPSDALLPNASNCSECDARDSWIRNRTKQSGVYLSTVLTIFCCFESIKGTCHSFRKEE